MEKDDLDRFERFGEQYEKDNAPRDGGSGGRPKAKEKHQGKETQEAKAAEMRQNRAEKALNTREQGGQAPVDEVQEVLNYVNKTDEDSVEMKNLYKYIAWLNQNINAIDELEVKDSEIGEMEAMTATLGAGGGGKDTSRNARAATHILTGIREKSQDDRKAEPNKEDVRLKIKKSLQTHLRNWKIIMTSLQADEDRIKKRPIDLKQLEEEVLRRTAV